MNQDKKETSYHQSTFNYIMDQAPYTAEMTNNVLPFVNAFGKTVYNQANLVDVENNLRGQHIKTNRCDNHQNTTLGDGK